MAPATKNNPALDDGQDRPAGPLLLSADQAAALCGVSPRMWWTLHTTGQVPLPVRLGRRALWRATGPGGLEAWVAAGCPPRERWEAAKGARR
jgi:predicted DNA-binding transcriptional regulator AlpA